MATLSLVRVRMISRCVTAVGANLKKNLCFTGHSMRLRYGVFNNSFMANFLEKEFL